MKTGILVGNPKPQSRTLQASRIVARRLTGRDTDSEIDLVALGADILSPSSERFASAVEAVRSCDVVILIGPHGRVQFDC